MKNVKNFYNYVILKKEPVPFGVLQRINAVLLPWVVWMERAGLASSVVMAVEVARLIWA
jgi:hypothetical protein